MGMCGNYIAGDKETIGKILTGKLELNEFEQNLLDAEKTSGVSDTDKSQYIGIDKSWQALHFLFCDDLFDGEPPLGYVVPMLIDLDITEKCECEFGAFHLNATQIKECYDSIKNLTKSDLFEMYDLNTMIEEGIYPIVDNENSEEFFEYIFEYFIRM